MSEVRLVVEVEGALGGEVGVKAAEGLIKPGEGLSHRRGRGSVEEGPVDVGGDGVPRRAATTGGWDDDVLAEEGSGAGVIRDDEVPILTGDEFQKRGDESRPVFPLLTVEEDGALRCLDITCANINGVVAENY